MYSELPLEQKQLSATCDGVVGKHLDALYSVVYDGSLSIEGCEQNYHKLLTVSRDCIPVSVI